MEGKTNLLVASGGDDIALAAIAFESSDEMLESLSAACRGPNTQVMVNSCYTRSSLTCP